MGKITIKKTKLQQMICEAVKEELNQSQTNPPTPKNSWQASDGNLEPIGINYPVTIKQAVDSIEYAKELLSRFNGMSGSFFGIPEEKMRLFSNAVNNLNAAENFLLNIQ